VSRRRARPQPDRGGPTPTPTPSNRQLLGCSIALVALVVGIYYRVHQFDFVPLDDPPYVSENPHVLGGLTADNVWWAFTTRWASYWIPLTWISYMVDVQLFGPGPGMLHVTNVLLHAANTVLLFWWLQRATRAAAASAFAAALFAAHPLHVESVVWITERKDVLSTLFLLLGLIAYSAYVRRKSVALYATVLACFVLGALAKPMVVTLPFMLLLCDVWPLGRVRIDSPAGWRAVIIEKWPLFLIAAAGSAVVFVTQQRGGAMIASEVFSLGLRIQNAIVSYVIYLWQTIWPAGLIVNYPYPSSIPLWQVVGAGLLLAAITFMTLRASRTRAHLAVGWLWYLGTLVPTIGLVQVGLQPRADRFTYVPLIGIFIVCAWSAAELAARRPALKRVVALAAVAITVAFAVGSHRQAEFWKDGLALWTRAVAVTPPAEAAQAEFELGAEWLRRNQPREAIPHFQAALRAHPTFTGAHAALGDAHQREGRTTDAKAAYQTALRLDDSLPEIHNNLGAILATEGQIDAALPYFQAAVRLKPDFESALVNLGVVLARLGRNDEARAALTSALRLNPSNAQARRVLELLR
jgi:Tfp pilus assembly protein PilF